jgi:tetratricopeptide (TPR) repeat protein
LVEQRRLHEAVRAYAVLVGASRDAGVWWEYGAVLAHVEDHRAAVAAFDRAVGLAPELGKAWNDRGVALVALERSEEARESFERALRVSRSQPAACANLANLHLAEGDLERAEALYRSALRDDVGHIVARLGLGRLLLRQERFSEAELEIGRARRRAPYSFDALLAEVTLGLATERLGEAIKACDRFLALSLHHSGGLGLRAELDRERAGDLHAQLLDPESWVQTCDLDVPAPLLEGLVEALATHHTLAHAPPHHATRAGHHSGALSGLEHGAIAQLESLLEAALLDYTPPRHAARFWSDMRPQAVALHSWAVLLRGEGFQLPHLHPRGWLSGVFYVAVPRAIQTGSESHRGCLEVGRPDPELALTKPRSSYFVRPRPGRVVIFPSWLYHSTVPHVGPGVRLSVGFDCVRASG